MAMFIKDIYVVQCFLAIILCQSMFLQLHFHVIQCSTISIYKCVLCYVLNEWSMLFLEAFVGVDGKSSVFGYTMK